MTQQDLFGPPADRLPQMPGEYAAGALYCGVLDTALACVSAGGVLRAFLDAAGQSSLREAVIPEDRPLLEKAAQTASRGIPGEAWVALQTAGGGRLFWLRLEPEGKAGKYLRLTLVDVGAAVREYPAWCRERRSLRRCMEDQQLVSFTVRPSSGERRLYRVLGGEDLPLSSPEHNAVLDLLLEQLRDAGMDKTSFVHTVTSGNKTYRCAGAALTLPGSRQELHGSILCLNDAGMGGVVLTENERDPFTGLYSKLSALAYGRRAVEQAGEGQVALCMIDLDKFKEINDAYGHLVGDSVIRKTAQILDQAVQGKGIAARFGGDEFFLVLDTPMEESELRALLRRIRVQLAMAFVDTPQNMVVTCSVGVAQYPQNGKSFDVLFRKADRGLYIAKEKGRNRYIIYRESLHGELPASDAPRRMDVAIRQSLNAGGILRGTADCVAELIRGGENSLRGVLEQLRLLYGFDGVTLYTGADLLRRWSSGAYPQPVIRSMACVQQAQVQALFDENGLCYATGEQGLGQEHQAFLKSHGIRSSLACMIGDKAHLRGLLTFDQTMESPHPSRQPSNEEQQLLVMFARVVSETVL